MNNSLTSFAMNAIHFSRRVSYHNVKTVLCKKQLAVEGGSTYTLVALVLGSYEPPRQSHRLTFHIEEGDGDYCSSRNMTCSHRFAHSTRKQAENLSSILSRYIEHTFDSFRREDAVLQSYGYVPFKDHLYCHYVRPIESTQAYVHAIRQSSALFFFVGNEQYLPYSGRPNHLYREQNSLSECVPLFEKEIDSFLPTSDRLSRSPELNDALVRTE